jgi:hypothetical protein
LLTGCASPSTSTGNALVPSLEPSSTATTATAAAPISSQQGGHSG